MRLRNGSRGRTGTVVVVAAISLVAVLSVAALALDGGMVMDKRRQVQATADAAAFAAASQLYVNWFTTYGLDTPDRSAANTALAVAAANGFEDGAGGCQVQVNIPPQGGPFAGQAGHAEVVIAYPQPLYFSQLFGTPRLPVGARAVGRGKRATVKNGIIALDPAAKGALTVGGNGTVAITGANVIVDSNSLQGLYANGTGASVRAAEYDLGGIPGWGVSGGATIASPTGGMPTVYSGQTPTPDPLRFVPQPDPTALTVQSTRKTQFSGGTHVLYPGVYTGGISVGGQASVTLMPGVYYMDGGGFGFSGQGSLTGTGVTIYNAPQSNSDSVNISGQGTVNLSPMSSGPTQGLLIWQDRAATTTVSVDGSNAASMTLSGTFYAANAQLNVSGNGTQQTLGSQYISRTASIGGNGGFTVKWDPSQVPGVRQVWLVE